MASTGAGPWTRSARGYTRPVLWLEIFYTALLVATFLIIGWFSVYVVYKLYQGQR